MNLAYARLSPLAESVFDAEKVRIAEQNRASAEQRMGFMEEGDAHSAMAEGFVHLERAARRHLDKAGARLPIADWLNETKGLGPAMLLFLGLVGDPLWNGAENRPRRGPGELIAYLGMDPRNGQARRKRRGEQVNFNVGARSVLLGRIAEAAYRQGHYREVYLAAREKYGDAVHRHECFNAVRPVNGGPPPRNNGCGTREHPEWGEVGSPLRDGHKHSRALRLVGRTIVLDLWNAAKATDE